MLTEMMMAHNQSMNQNEFILYSTITICCKQIRRVSVEHTDV